MRRLEETVVVGQLFYLLARDFSEVLTPIAHVDTPEARHAIHQLVAISVPQIHAFGTFDNAGTTFMHPFVIGERMEKVSVVKRLILSGGQRHVDAPRQQTFFGIGLPS